MPIRRIALPALLLAAAPVVADEPPREPVRTAALSAASRTAPADAGVGPVMTVDALTGEEAYAFQLETLRRAAEVLAEVDAYTAELTKQEKIGGRLSSRQRIVFKQAYGPFRVYMKWLTGDRGREAIYVDGQNGNQTVVHAGGWKARFLPVLTIDPNGSMAMKESRHPITGAGLRNLTAKWIASREADEAETGMTYRVEASSFDGRPCHKFTAVYARPAADPTYSKVELWVDAERLVPLAALNYGWRDGDLLERYEYRKVVLDAPLTAADFDRKNRKYAFKK